MKIDQGNVSIAKTRSPLLDALDYKISKSGAETAFRRKRRGIWEPVNWIQCGARIAEILAKLRLIPLENGKPVALLAAQEPDCALVDIAVSCAGFPCVLINDEADQAQTIKLLKDLGIQAFIAFEPHFLTKARILHQQLETTQGVIDLSPAFEVKDDDLPWQSLAFPSQPDADDIATIIVRQTWKHGAQTVQLTHRQIAAWSEGFVKSLPRENALKELFAVGEPANLSSRLATTWLPLFIPMTVNFAESRETQLVDLVELQPSILITEGRNLERLRASLERRMADAPLLARAAYNYAIKLGGVVESRKLVGHGNSWWRRLLNSTLGWLLLRSVREAAGGSDAVSWVAGTTVSPRLLVWYRTLGIPLHDIDLEAAILSSGGVVDTQRLPVLSDDKKSVAGIENELCFSRYIADTKWQENAVDVQLDMESILQYAQDQRLSYANEDNLIELPEVRALVESEIGAALKNLPITIRPNVVRISRSIS